MIDVDETYTSVLRDQLRQPRKTYRRKKKYPTDADGENIKCSSNSNMSEGSGKGLENVPSSNSVSSDARTCSPMPTTITSRIDTITNTFHSMASEALPSGDSRVLTSNPQSTSLPSSEAKLVAARTESLKSSPTVSIKQRHVRQLFLRGDNVVSIFLCT